MKAKQFSKFNLGGWKTLVPVHTQKISQNFTHLDLWELEVLAFAYI